MISAATVPDKSVGEYLRKLEEGYRSGDVPAEKIIEFCLQALRESGKYDSITIRSLKKVREEAERNEIIKALNVSNGRKDKAAKILGISKDVLRKRIAKYKISPAFRPTYYKAPFTV